MKKRAFTLIEMMIVVAIIAILAGMAVPLYQRYVQKSEAMEAVRLMKQIADAEVAFYGAQTKYITNRNALMVEIPTSKFNYYISVDGGANGFVDSTAGGATNDSIPNSTCFVVKAELKTDTARNLYLIYPDNTSACKASIDADSGIADVTDSANADFWDASVFYGVYYN